MQYPSEEVLQYAAERAARRTLGRYTEDQLVGAASRGELLPIQVGKEGVVFVALVPFPNRMVANLIAAGGRLPEDPRAAFGELEQLLVGSFGVQQIEVIGRPGWARVLGLRPVGQQLIKEVGP